MRFGIDYAWGGPPSIAALKRAGVTFVCRYLSRDPAKNLNPHEYNEFRAHDIDVNVVWETDAERARLGQLAGRDDAIAAEAQRMHCGMPEEQVIYLAVDFDAQGVEIEDYFHGARQILRGRLGAYAGYNAIKYLFDHGLIDHAWQTYAWSAGQWDPRARIRQYSNNHTLDGVSVDYNIELAPANVPYVPADEHNWIREYDRLSQQKRAAWRRTWLRHTMTSRRKKIWRLAQIGGWEMLNRANRYHQLAIRTE